MLNSKILKRLEKDHRVMFVDDERSIGNSLIVTLNYGHTFRESEREHVRGFNTIAEVLDAMREVNTCTCPECLSKLNERGANHG